MTSTAVGIVATLGVSLVGCSDGGGNGAGPDSGTTESGSTACAPEDIRDSPVRALEGKPAHEILHVVSPTQITVWLSLEVSQDEFDAIELPPEWRKNNPLEPQIDSGRFFRSPDASEDGPLTTAEHFGHRWQHPATIVEIGVALEDEGLLGVARVAKFHELVYDACRRVVFLVSPEGDQYVRVSRDAGRATDTFTVPNGWQVIRHVAEEELNFRLPNPTTVIRTENQDSFQGPVTGVDLELDLPPD